MHLIYSKLSEELKNSIDILVGKVMNQNSQNIVVLINNSRTAWCTKRFNVFFQFLGQFTKRCMILFKKC